jgi:hypothetical protein
VNGGAGVPRASIVDSVAMPATVGPQRLCPGMIATDDLAASDKPPLVLLHPYLCWGPPVKVDPLVVSVVWPRSGHMPCGGGPQSGSRWSARSAARTNDLDADRDPPHTVAGQDEVKPLWFKSSAASRETESVVTLRVPAPSLIWVHGRGSGDMMMDGVPDGRAAKGVRPLILSGKSTQQRGGDRNAAGAGRGGCPEFRGSSVAAR